MKVANMIFARRIKKLREEKGESQEDLAKLVGYKKQAVSHWETNGKVPRTWVLKFLSEHYSTTSDYLLGILSPQGTDAQNLAVSPDEMELLQRYRRMEEFQKNTIRQVAESIAPFKLHKKSIETNGVF